MFPGRRIFVRPHPGGNCNYNFARAVSVFEGTFLEWVSWAFVDEAVWRSFM